MNSLPINDDDAEKLINLVKKLENRVAKTLTEKDTGVIKIIGENDHPFLLNYFFSANKKTINFREGIHNINLIRININNGFHRNANQKKVSGPRINVFSEVEFFEKGDGTTYMKSHPLPYKNIDYLDNFIQLLEDTLEYLNTEYKELLELNIQTELI